MVLAVLTAGVLHEFLPNAFRVFLRGSSKPPALCWSSSLCWSSATPVWSTSSGVVAGHRQRRNRTHHQHYPTAHHRGPGRGWRTWLPSGCAV